MSPGPGLLRWTLVGAGLVGASALAVLLRPAHLGPRARTDSAGPAARPIRTAAVQKAPHYTTLRFVGVVRSEDRADLAFTTGGRVISRRARVGHKVKQGEELARLDLLPLQNTVRVTRGQVQDIEARLLQLERDVRRTQRLHDENAAPEEVLEKLQSARDGTRAGLEAARARLQEASRQLRDARLVAPFDGTVVAVRLEAGEVAQPGEPVVMLTAQNRFEVALEVPERVRAGLTVRDRAAVRFPLAGLAPTGGTIDRLSTAADGPGQLFTVVVALEPTAGLSAGYTAEVTLRTRRNDGLMVPIAAVADPGGQSPFVFRVRNGQAERLPVRIGGLVEDHVTVEARLQVSDRIVVEGHGNLLDGETVQEVP